MTADNTDFVVVLVEDDEDYYLLMKEAFDKTGFSDELHWIKDGEEFMNYLDGSELSGYSKDDTKSMIVLMDLNMPRMNGFQALEKMKADKRFRQIPVIVLTTSKSEEDITRSYSLGANAFITKPSDFSKIVQMVEGIQKYWMGIVKFPGNQ